MKKTYLVLLIFCSALVYGQETIKKTVSRANQNYKEIYYVLKSDTTILHGSYTKLTNLNRVQIEGFYKNGAKDSIWTEYSLSQKKIKKGKYQADKKVEDWDFYDAEGKLDQCIDFTTNSVLYFKDNDKKFTIIGNADPKKVKLDQPPLYAEGKMDIIKIINSNIRYPANAVNNNVTGTVEITFTIDSIGKTSNYRVTKKIGSGCDEEALRVIKMIPENWLPGIFQGKAVSVDYVIPVIYGMQ